MITITITTDTSTDLYKSLIAFLETEKIPFTQSPVLLQADVVRSKIAVGDRVIVEKGNRSIYTVQHIKGSVVWFEETNDSCFVDECTKV